MIGAPASAPEVWIADSTPVIVLAKIGRLDLLTSATREVLLPSPVASEIRRGALSDPARAALAAGWGTIVSVRYTRAAVRAVGLLGLGEQSVLTLALRRPGTRAVLDDEQARKAAQQLGIPHIGTLGVIVLAKSQGRIDAVTPLFHALLKAGFYVDDRFLRWLSTAQGEAWP